MATQYAGGPILSIPVTTGGTGYASSPTVNLAGTGYGFGATFTANFSGGAVTSITVNTGGHLYPISGVTATVSGGSGTGCVLGAPVVSSGDVNTTFTSDGTKQSLINSMETALLAAGWTTVSGHATTNLLMQTHATPYPLQANFRFKDNGGTGIQISLENTAGSLAGANSTSAGASITPVNTRVFRIIANPYQFCIVAVGIFTTSSTYAFGCVPYVPSFLTGVTAAGFIISDASVDNDTNTNRTKWRTQLIQSGGSFTSPNQQLLWNSSLNQNNNSGSPNQGGASLIQLLIPMMAWYGSIGVSLGTFAQPYRWAGLQIHSCDPLVSWGLTSANDEPLIRGQIWDATVVCDAYAGDTTSSWDGHNWFALTANNAGGGGTSGQAGPRGTLFLVIP